MKSSSIPVVGSLTTVRPECSGDGLQLSRESTLISLRVTLIKIKTNDISSQMIFVNWITIISFCRNPYFRNFWNAKSLSCIGSQEGSRKKRFSASFSRVRLVGGSPWGNCRGKYQSKYSIGAIDLVSKNRTNEILVKTSQIITKCSRWDNLNIKDCPICMKSHSC